jgi:hypothetical protein
MFFFSLCATHFLKSCQRRFAWENKSVLGVDEDEVSESEDSTELDTPAVGRKRKRGSPKGRVAHGDDFWSRVDSWFQERISLWGSDFSGADWKL